MTDLPEHDRVRCRIADLWDGRSMLIIDEGARWPDARTELCLLDAQGEHVCDLTLDRIDEESLAVSGVQPWFLSFFDPGAHGRRVLFHLEDRDEDHWLTLEGPHAPECLGHVFLARVDERLFELRDTRGPSHPPTHRVGEPAP